MENDLPNTLSLSARVESVLFAHGEPMKLKQLAKTLDVSEEDAAQALEELAEVLSKGRGIGILKKDDSVQLVTHPEASTWVGRLFQQETKPQLSPSVLETLALVAYRCPISRVDIDAVRGVNSSFALRQLLMRGLIEREEDAEDSRLFLYSPTTKCLKVLAIKSLDQLPEYGSLSHHQRISNIQQQNEEKTHE